MKAQRGGLRGSPCCWEVMGSLGGNEHPFLLKAPFCPWDGCSFLWMLLCKRPGGWRGADREGVLERMKRGRWGGGSGEDEEGQMGRGCWRG